MSLRSGLVRSLTTLFGLGAIAWATAAFPALRAEMPVDAAAQQILSGQRFSSEQLKEIVTQLKALPARSLTPSALNDIVVVRLQLLVDTPARGEEIKPSDVSDLDEAVRVALAAAPPASFSWLTAYWLGDLRGTAVADRSKLLKMSYATGPNEAWIAVRRSPIALRAISSLPDDIVEAVLTEYADLVRSDIYLPAARILAGAMPAAREKLRDRLLQLPEGDRVALARMMERLDLDTSMVPGVDLRRSRPF